MQRHERSIVKWFATINNLEAASQWLWVVGLFALTIMLFTSGVVFAQPEVTNATTNLHGALVPGGEVVFTAEGTPGCTAILRISIRVNGSSTPLTWDSPMLEEDDGVYVSRWNVIENMDITLVSATVEFTDRGGEKSSIRSAISGPVSTGGSIQGKVTDYLAGAPLSDIQVFAYSPSTRHFAMTRTNQRGEFVLAGLGQSSDYRLWTVNDQGFADSKREGVYVYRNGSTWPTDIVLSGLSAVSGYVEDETGAPLSGVAVTAEQQDGVRQRTAITNEKGKFTIAGLSEGSCDLRATLGSIDGFATVDIISGRVASANFRLSPPRLISSYEVYIEGADNLSRIMFWPRHGGPMRAAVVFENGNVKLSNVMTGEELILCLEGNDRSPRYFSLRPTDGLIKPPIDEILANSSPSTLLTIAPPLVTRGGSAILGGKAEGSDWVDVWLDAQLQGRFPVFGGQWQVSLSLAEGNHSVSVTSVGSYPLQAERSIIVTRDTPTISLIAINGQPRLSWLSGDGGSEYYTNPNQAITFSLVADQRGTTNWLTVDERKWPMSIGDNTLTATLPAIAISEGKHLVSWGYELEGKKNEIALGSLVVSKPITLTVVDALTGEPVPTVTATIEQHTDRGWVIDPNSQLACGESSQLNIWLASQTDHRLRIYQNGYQPSVISLHEPDLVHGQFVTLMPTQPNGPVSLSPARDTKMQLGDSITVTFARDLDPASINSKAFYIRGMESQFTYDPLTRKASLQPLSRLAENSYYLVQLSGSVCYADGTPLGRDLYWLINTSEVSRSDDRISASRLVAPGMAAILASKDSGAKVTIPSGSSPVQTLYRLTRPATFLKELPKGWQAVTAALDFSAINSPLDRPIQRLLQGADVSIYYTDPPTEGQTVTLWRYEPSTLTWVEHPYEHDPYLRTVHFTTDRPGLFVFAKMK